MKFHSLDVTRFALFQEPFHLPLSDQGLVLVEGSNLDAPGPSSSSNGSGKSMVFEAIPWCLWGKMSRYGDRRLGLEETGPADVALDLETAGGRFRVRRTRSAKGAVKIAVHPIIDGVIGDPLPQSPVTATGDLTPLVGFDYDTFRSALFLQATGLTVTTAGFSGQMKLLESVLRFDVLSAAKTVSTERAKKLQERKQVAQREHDQARSEWLLASTLLEQVASSDTTRSDLESLFVEEADILSEMERLGQIIEKKSPRLEPNNASQKALQVCRALTADAREQLAITRSQKATKEKLVKEGRCWTCFQPVSQGLSLDVTDLEQREKTLLAVITDSVKAEASAEEDLYRLEALIHEVDSAIKSLRTIQPRLADLQERKQVLLNRQKKVTQGREEATKRVAEAESRVEEWSTRLFNLDSYESTATFWVKAFGSDGLKAEILAQAAPILNQAALRYADLLTDGAVRVEFQPLRDSKGEDLIHLSGPWAAKYHGLSSGERRRVDLIVALSLRTLARWRLAQPLNLSLWDEVFDTLDASGLQRVVGLLQQDTDELGSAFVVTHRSDFKSIFPGARTLRIRREGGKATVHYDR